MNGSGQRALLKTRLNEIKEQDQDKNFDDEKSMVQIAIPLPPQSPIMWFHRDELIRIGLPANTRGMEEYVKEQWQQLSEEKKNIYIQRSKDVFQKSRIEYQKREEASKKRSVRSTSYQQYLKQFAFLSVPSEDSSPSSTATPTPTETPRDSPLPSPTAKKRLSIAIAIDDDDEIDRGKKEGSVQSDSVFFDDW